MTTSYLPLLVEDSPTDAQLLIDYLGQTQLFQPPMLATSAQEAFSILSTHTVDLLFLDINLQGLSGLDLINILPDHLPVVIVSAHPQYAVDCYDLDVLDFLQKPYTYQRLLRGIGRCMKNILPAPLPQTPVAAPKHIYLQVGRKSERFLLTDILFIEAYGIYCKLNTIHGMVVVNEQISEMEALLPTHSFVRIHKSYIINLLQITRVEYKTLWTDKQKLPIGVTHRERVHKLLKELRIEQ